jgi:hypothetical protein
MESALVAVTLAISIRSGELWVLDAAGALSATADFGVLGNDGN